MMTYELCNVLILMKNERGEVLFISFATGIQVIRNHPDINIFEWKNRAMYHIIWIFIV